MRCYYCDRIVERDPGYSPRPACYDLGSAAPRCARHWRYLCGRCGQPRHFMATAWDAVAGRFFCDGCATGREIVQDSFWAWGYWFRYRSPFTGGWSAGLDRLEFEGIHPLQRYPGDHHPCLSREMNLVRYPDPPAQWPLDHVPDDEEIRRSWNANAVRWDRACGPDGDDHRRCRSDEPMLRLLGDVTGRHVLDAGSGNGYLCRKLARAGAVVTGVELSDSLHRIAEAREAREPLGITYRNASIASMPFLASGSVDKAVSNYVLMDVADLGQALAEIRRVLKPGGALVAVISHPCFTCGPGGWLRPAPDSPRLEERQAHLVDNYFRAGPIAARWGELDPVPVFHRPLQDYWRAFRAARFALDEFVEPSISERGQRGLPPVEIEQALRIAWSCIFRIVRS